MDLNLTGRRAVVTGASKGIGWEVAISLAQEGCEVIAAARDAAALASLTASINDLGVGSCRSVEVDLSQEDGRRRLLETAEQVDILVNNAGAIPSGDLGHLSDEAWRAGWELKVFGYIALCRAVYPQMAARRSGVIVNVIGSAGLRPNPGYIAGTSGNAALIAFTQALGKSSVRDHVRVVGVNPGLTWTDRAQDLLRRTAEAEFGDAGRWAELLPGLPFGRAAEAAEVAAAVAFLASDRSGYTSGALLAIDGGTSV